MPDRCDCANGCRDRATLREKHGTPENFRAACINALDMITFDEADAAVRKYERLWAALPEVAP